MKTTRTTCPYCGVGCGVVVQQSPDGGVTIKGDETHPANRGRLCSKGAALAETVNHPERLLYPEIRGERVDWKAATGAVAKKFKQVIAEHGPEAVAFYVSGQLLTEDYYVANKLMKGYIGTANIDTNSRLCMSSAVAAHKRAFGEDLVPCSYEDLEAAELIVLVGSNTAWCHPVLYQRITKAKQANPALKVVLIDPRRTQTADSADLHLALKTGTDAFLFNGLLSYLDQHGHTNNDFIREHSNGLDQALQAASTSDTTAKVAQQCGLSAETVTRFFALFASTEKVVSVFSQGINQSSSGVDKGNALINCHLLTGRIGREGMGPFSFTGQPNAMGGREVGGLANQLAAHMDIENPEHREWVQTFWQSPAIAQQQGLKTVDLFEAIHAGKVKAVWIMATNPAVSLPDVARVQAALKKCEMVVVSDCVSSSDTLRYADIRLPALSWGERNGTVTNSERMISRQRPFLPAPGEAKADWEIVCAVAQQMGHVDAFSYADSRAIFREHAALSAFQNKGERCFNIGALANISPQSFDELAPVQWPLRKHPTRSGQYVSSKRLFSDGHFFTKDGRANLIAVTPRLPQSTTNRDYPLVLNTGRVRDHWHTLTRTGISARLSSHRAEAYIDLHPDDANAQGIKNNTLVRVFNALGEICVRAQITTDQQQGTVFVPIHWNDEFSSNAAPCRLIPSVTDPISGQPESKHAAVQIAPYPAVWHGFMLSRRKMQLGACYWSAHRSAEAWHYTLASDQTAITWEGAARDLLCGDGDMINWVEYSDKKRQIYRAARFLGEALESCLFISGANMPLPDSAWLLSLFAKERLDSTERQSLLSGQAAVPMAAVGKTVCACFNVGEKTIRNAIEQQGLNSVEQLGECLGAGTNCGSCLPELRAML